MKSKLFLASAAFVSLATGSFAAFAGTEAFKNIFHSIYLLDDSGDFSTKITVANTQDENLTLVLPDNEGMNGQVLKTDGVGNLGWASSLTNPMSSAGDVIIGGTGGAAQRLGVGTDGQVLTVASGAPAWAGPATAVSMDDATATKMGLKSYFHGTTYNGGNSPTITGPSGISNIVSECIPYQMQDGHWRMRFNTYFTLTANITLDFAIAGVTFNSQQAVTVLSTPASMAARTDASNGNVIVRTSSNATVAIAAGDVALSSKPTWAY